MTYASKIIKLSSKDIRSHLTYSSALIKVKKTEGMYSSTATYKAEFELGNSYKYLLLYVFSRENGLSKIMSTSDFPQVDLEPYSYSSSLEECKKIITKFFKEAEKAAILFETEDVE
jgi:hypothetical protein